jgi:hypothetical protein
MPRTMQAAVLVCVVRFAFERPRVKHQPWLPLKRREWLPFKRREQDLASQPPNFGYTVPDECSDMHGAPYCVDSGDLFFLELCRNECERHLDVKPPNRRLEIPTRLDPMNG